MANQSRNTRHSGRRYGGLTIKPLVLAFAASLLAGPVNATITLPNDPLTTSARVAPNILLLLDDSNSMSWDYMPDTVPALSSPADRYRAYTRNAVFYNPHVDYQPWVNAAGVAMTGGLSYNAAYTNANLASGGTTNLQTSAKTYYVPKSQSVALDPSTATEAELSNGANYYRYQIHTDGVVVRSEYGARTGNSPNYNRGLADRNCSTGGGNDWRNCTAITPTGRTDAEERANYAAWHSYGRTRMKAAKSGVSLAFSQLGNDLRVGLRTINGITPGGLSANSPTQGVPIPVNYNQGLFADPEGAAGANNNRTRWFDRMQATTTTGSTPLRSALENAGKYFQSNATTGPYGPEPAASQLSCRQNFTILTTDGFWNLDNGINFGNADNEAGSEISGPGGKTYRYQPAVPYSSSDGSTLADVAMKYWKQDLRPDLENNVPTTAANPGFWQHMVTFGISIGLRGTLDQSSVGEVLANGSPRKNGVNVGWPQPKADSINNIDDLLHAAVNGRGQFIAASNPQALSSGLQSALAAITERTGSFSNVSANSTSVDGGTRLYQASYVSGVWTGEVQAYPVTATGGVSVTAAWRASTGVPATGRKVFAGNEAGTGAVVFPAGLSSERVAALARTGVTNYPVTGEQNAAYLAGDRSRELQNGGELRNRNHLLGDVVSSSPAYASDSDTLFVGSNDGMLHAINAANGNELFTYIPGGISWPDFASLSRPDYAHRYFVDGPIVVSSRAQTPGKNVLVGALGKGGRGLYALDVTSPSGFSVDSFKWEVRDGGGNMGLVQSKPFIARLNNGTMAVIVANGINSANGRAALLVYNLDTGAQIAALDTGVGSAVQDDPDSNGLTSAVGWDADGNGTVDAVYGGDMLGNVWKFDISSSSVASWDIADDQALFTATAPDGSRQPITGGLTVAMHPRTYQPWLFFGTGRMMTSGDLTDQSVQSLYAFMDDGTQKARTGVNANLTKRTTVLSGVVSNYPIRAFEANAPLPAGSKGWYLDLLTPPAPGTAEGERVISDAQLYGDVLIVSSVIPTADACQADGRGYLNALDAFTGTSTEPSLFDLDGDGSFEDETIGDDNLPVGSVDLGVGMPTLAEVLRGLAVVGGSSGSLGSVPIRETRNVGRVSWREVLTN